MEQRKNGISARIIADNKSPYGNRLTTFVCVFPRIILAELNTHRMLSRNSASSRAIPFEKMLKRVKEEPFIPIAWQKDHKGMQGTEYFTNPEEIKALEDAWIMAAKSASDRAELFSEGGVTKQIVNRLLEPFMMHTAIITASELENFFALRCPQYEWNGNFYRSWKDLGIAVGRSTDEYHDSASIIERLSINKGQGEIHIMALAEAMWNALNESKSKELKAGEWHIPFGDTIGASDEKWRELEDIISNGEKITWKLGGFELAVQETQVKIATARCARVSYLNFEGKDDYKADIRLHDILLKSGHGSPLEHCAKAMEDSKFYKNFSGWKQYRQIIEEK